MGNSTLQSLAPMRSLSVAFQYRGTRFGCLPYLTHPLQILESLLMRADSGGVEKCLDLVGVRPGKRLGNTVLVTLKTLISLFGCVLL